jgi:nicotinate-nucleotide adenylyltransferase
LTWLRRLRAAVLLGAFDPPTNAHVAILNAAAGHLGLPGMLCATSVTLARPPERLLDDRTRVRILEALAESEGFALYVAGAGTYLAVARELRSSGIEPAFVVGSDKLPQLADSSFHEDGTAGVEATFREVDFVVIERPGAPLRESRFPVVPVGPMPLSATEVRRRVRAGEAFDDLVPPVVAKALEGYTAPGLT